MTPEINMLEIPELQEMPGGRLWKSIPPWRKWESILGEGLGINLGERPGINLGASAYSPPGINSGRGRAFINHNWPLSHQSID